MRCTICMLCYRISRFCHLDWCSSKKSSWEQVLLDACRIMKGRMGSGLHACVLWLVCTYKHELVHGLAACNIWKVVDTRRTWAREQTPYALYLLGYGQLSSFTPPYLGCCCFWAEQLVPTEKIWESKEGKGGRAKKHTWKKITSSIEMILHMTMLFSSFLVACQSNLHIGAWSFHIAVPKMSCNLRREVTNIVMGFSRSGILLRCEMCHAWAKTWRDSGDDRSTTLHPLPQNLFTVPKQWPPDFCVSPAEIIRRKMGDIWFPD